MAGEEVEKGESGDKQALAVQSTLKFPAKRNERERFRTVLAFFIFGTLTYATYSLIIAGTQDILAGTYIQTSLVLVANIGPYFLVTLIAPSFMQRIAYFPRISTVFICGITGFITVVFAKKVFWKLIGVGVASIGYGVGEVTFLALSSFYHEIALNAYSSGTGAGFVLAPLYYTAMTTWFCLTPNSTILIMAGMLLFLFASYYVMDKKHLDSNNPSSGSHKDVPYVPLQPSESVPSDEDEANGAKTKPDPLTWQEKFSVMKRMLPHLLPLFIAWFSEYMIIQAVITTLAFPNAPFRPRDHYQYYIFVFLSGEVIGRSYLVVLSYLKPDLVAKAKISRLWVLSAIEVCHLIFFVFATWYRFLPSVWIVLVLSFTGGVTIGVFFVNALSFFREAFEDRYREFAMGYVVVAMGGGTFTAALMGLYAEPLLRRHCLVLLSNDDYCFTRSKEIGHIMSNCMAKPT